MTAIRLAIFASGAGSNAQNIVNYFADVTDVSTPLIVTENKNAAVLNRMENYDLYTRYIPLSKINTPEFILPLLEKTYQITHIALAGYLKLIPAFLIQAYPQKIINLHPALLPKYGGKGMYGRHVHRAVKQNKETQSGISIHLVNEKFDEGHMICQKSIDINKGDRVEDIEQKVRKLEHQFYPKAIHNYITSL